MAGGPLEGLRVIDVGTRIGAPFCAGLLGEWGADVVKVEQPGTGDFMRGIGPFVNVRQNAGDDGAGDDGAGDDGAGDDGTGGDEAGDDSAYSLFWAVEGRGRRSVTCDLRRSEGQALFRRLATHADVVCENFRPGTMEEWGIGPAALDPRIVMVRISAFGQDGPYAQRPGLDRLGVAYGGLLHLTGEPDRPPVRPGVTVADYLTGVFAAEAALAALYRRDAKGEARGAVVDASLYGSVLRILEWTVAAHDKLGVVRQREGNRLSNSAPLDNYRSSDGRFVCIVAGSDANFSRLCRAMGRTELVDDPRYRTLADRARHGEEINGEVARWAAQHTASELEEMCVAHDVPVATAYNATEIALDPHFVFRGDLVEVADPVVGALRQQAPYPRLVGEAQPAPAGAPRLGADNEAVWCGLVGLSKAELGELVSKGVV